LFIDEKLQLKMMFEKLIFEFYKSQVVILRIKKMNQKKIIYFDMHSDEIQFDEH
jgi:hypothetical protein